MSAFKVGIRLGGSNARGTWAVVKSLPVELGLKLAPLADLTDFVTLTKADGSAAAVPTKDSTIDVVDVRLQRFHRREGEGDSATYSPTPSFALELVVA